MIEEQQVKKAVGALKELLKKKDDNVLFDQPEKIDVQFTLKQIPRLKQKNIHINLPHSLHYDTREVCVFVKDLDKKKREYEPTVEHYETLFKQKHVKNISKIVPLKALRTDYSMHSNKRSLAKAYDLFLGDDCVMGLLPGILGKIFYDKKKTVPVSVNLGLKDLKKEVDRVVHNTRCILKGSGSTSMVCIGNNKMPATELVANVVAACKQLMEKIPGGKANFRNMYLKTTDSPAIPLFVNLESPNDVELPKVKKESIQTFVDEISTLSAGKKVMVRADGVVKVIKNKEKSLKAKNDERKTEETTLEEEENDDESEEDSEDIDSDADDVSSGAEEETTQVIQKSSKKPLKEVTKKPLKEVTKQQNLTKNGRKRTKDEINDKAVAKKKQKQSDADETLDVEETETPIKKSKKPKSGKKTLVAKQIDDGKMSTPAKEKVIKQTDEPLTDQKHTPRSGKKHKKQLKNA